MVTARVAAENRLESFGVGADDYVPKPYTPDQIFQALHSASSWRTRLGGPVIEGRIPLGPAGAEETVRRLGQLRNLLVARTSLDRDQIDELNAALGEVDRDVSASSGKPAHAHASTPALGFELRPDRLILTMHDDSGRLAGPDAQEHAVPLWSTLLERAGFVPVHGEPPPGCRMRVEKTLTASG